MNSSIVTEVNHLQNINEVAFALIQYARSLEPESDYVPENDRFVLRPANFVTFSVRWKKANNITVSLRGNPNEFEKLPELLIQQDQNGYSLFRFEQVNQLFAAASYIRRAHELFERGRQRRQTTPLTVER